MPRTPARKRPIPRGRTKSGWYGYGKQFTDAISGWSFPVKTHQMRQRGQTISRDFKDGSRDRPDNY